jgi:hypothetical protein
MMQAVHTSETSVYFNETTWSYIPEACHLHPQNFELELERAWKEAIVA